MISYISHVMTLANSIIGVSVLAMPFCFKQCGIILSIVVLTLCSLLSRMACHFLIKSAVMSRRRNYEFLAFHAFGPIGKISVELLIIGFLIGTCIAFFVVIGDLGPQIIGKLLNKNPEDIRLSFLLTTASLIILPLGLLKNIGSLASICTVAIGFYLCLVLKVLMESIGHIFTGDWYDDVNYWRPAGILQCLPIFSMALFCQTQLFEIYESIPNVSLEKMNVVIEGAINICTLVYVSVGFFGYVAFCSQSISGNILLSFEPSMTSDIIKIGFVLSVIGSFPLVIFPCRASLNSLLFRRVYIHEGITNYMPEVRFRCLTFTIIIVSLITALLMPNIEFVLGLVGSTIGVMICLIFPAAFFIAISTKNTNERLIAQAMLFIGMWIMILGTYASIYSVEESSTNKIAIPTEKSILQINNIQINSNIENREIISKALQLPDEKKELSLSPSRVNLDKILDPENFIDVQKANVQVQKKMNNINLTFQHTDIKPIIEKSNIFDENLNIKIDNSIKIDTMILKEPLTAEEKMKAIEEKEKNIAMQVNDNLINSDAIKKEESEIAAAADQLVDVEAVERLNKKQRIEDTLEQHKFETIELMKEQKAILQNLKEQKKEMEKEKKFLQNLESNKIDKIIVQPISDTVSKKNNVEINELKTNKNHPISEATEQMNEKNIVNHDLKSTHEIEKQSINKNVNVSLESRGPILNALINKTIQHTDTPLINEISKKLNENISNNVQYAIPIALKLVNQTKDEVKTVDTLEIADKSLAIHRDILVDHEREKRDASNDTINKSITRNSNIAYTNSENQECVKNTSHLAVDNFNNSNNIVIVPSTTEILIKTNAYLSDEKFIHNIDKFDMNPITNNEYQIVKKRDLKSL